MFKWLLDNSLTNRLLVIIASVVLMAYGAFTLSTTPVDVFPDLNKPTVTIMTEAGGMAAEEVEQLITFPLETTMNGLPGVESVRSTSSGRPVLPLRHLRLEHRHLPRPAAGVRAAVVDGRRHRRGRGAAHGARSARSWARSCRSRSPSIRARSAPWQVREYADWVLRPRLLSVPGVAQVIPIGGEVRQFQVQPNTTRMAELGITHDQLEGALKGYSSNTSGGFLELNGREYLIRNLGRTSRLDDLKNLALTDQERPTHPDAPDRRGDIRPPLKRGDAGTKANRR
jgi:HME family heavy-metal exporter